MKTNLDLRDLLADVLICMRECEQMFTEQCKVGQLFGNHLGILFKSKAVSVKTFTHDAKEKRKPNSDKYISSCIREVLTA